MWPNRASERTKVRGGQHERRDPGGGLVGSRLVSLVLARWTHVSDRAFRVLVRMAHTALDEPSNGQPSELYFGGRELLLMTLRDEGGSQETRYRALKRIIAELIDAGAIERVQAGRAGRNAVYKLTLDGARKIDKPVDDVSTTKAQGGLQSPPEGGPVSPPEGGLQSPFRGAPQTPPRNQEEPEKELSEEEEINLRTAVTVSRARAEVDQKTHEENEPQDQLTLRVIPGGRSLTGLGLCVRCYLDHRQIVLATDPQHGSYCRHHQRLAS